MVEIRVTTEDDWQALKRVRLAALRDSLDVSPQNTRASAFYQKQGFTFLPQWEALESHPHIQVQKMVWVDDARGAESMTG